MCSGFYIEEQLRILHRDTHPGGVLQCLISVLYSTDIKHCNISLAIYEPTERDTNDSSISISNVKND